MKASTPRALPEDTVGVRPGLRPKHRRELTGARAPLGKLRGRAQSQWAVEGAPRVAGRGRRGPGWGWAIRASLCEEATGKLRRKGAGAQTQKRRQNSPKEKPKHQGPGLPNAIAARTSPSNAGVGV